MDAFALVMAVTALNAALVFAVIRYYAERVAKANPALSVGMQALRVGSDEEARKWIL